MSESIADKARQAAEQRRIQRAVEAQEREEREAAKREERAIRELGELLGVEPDVITHNGQTVELEADGLAFQWRPVSAPHGYADKMPGDIYLVRDGESPTRITSLADLGDALEGREDERRPGYRTVVNPS